MNYLKPTILISLLIVLCSSFAYADVIGHVTVTWTNVAGNFYNTTVCIEDTSIFGGFNEILVSYSYFDRETPPSPRSATLTDFGNNKYCAYLTSDLWSSSTPADTLYGAWFAIKHPSCDGGMCYTDNYNDNPWSVDTPNILDDPSHLFTWIGGTPSCTDGDSDNFNISSPGCGSPDCDDNEAAMYPRNTETCDNLDNDCDGATDEGSSLCTAYNIPGIATCTNSPDDIALTWDYFAGFTSACTAGACTTGTLSLTHTCDIAQCSAECVTNPDCNNKCVGEVYYHSGSCQSGCTCSYSTEDCNTHDGWVDTTNLQWVDTSLCTEKEQKEQQYRDYSCVAVSGCEFTVTQTQWVDTGATRNKADNTVCGSKDVCSAGICIGVACFNKAHCGTDGPIGSDYCSGNDVYQDYRTFTCNNPSTISSSCSQADTSQLKEACDTNEFCEDGDCYVKIDLTVSRVDVSRVNSPTAGGLTLIRFILNNDEANPVSNIEYSIDTGSADPNPKYNIPNIGASSLMKVWSSWIYASSGSYSAKVILDPDNKIRETDETNNEKTFTVNVS